MSDINLASTLPVANSILKRAFNEGVPVSPMKLQKLMYFVYKRYLKETGYALFDEDFEAWQWGPVLRSVYHSFKEYGADAIDEYASDGRKNAMLISDDDVQFYDALNYVWKKYSGFSGWYLSQLTHKENTAWSKASSNNRLYISYKDIEEEEWEE